MKTFSRTLGIGVVVAAFAVLTATATAAEFGSSRTLPGPCNEVEPCTTKGTSIGGERPEELVFGVFHIDCAARTFAKTVGEGAITWETSTTLATEVKFTKCLTEAKFGTFVGGLHTSFNENKPMKVVYHINHFAETGTGETFTEVELGGGAASFHISGKICNISWPAQTIPVRAETHPAEEFSAAVYSNKEVPVEEKQWKKFPSHFQTRLVITNEFKGMSWEYEEGQCLGEGGFEEEAAHTEGKTAKWTGALELQVNSGNLFYIP
jgi:hypothetical protein